MKFPYLNLLGKLLLDLNDKKITPLQNVTEVFPTYIGGGSIQYQIEKTYKEYFAQYSKEFNIKSMYFFNGEERTLDNDTTTIMPQFQQLRWIIRIFNVMLLHLSQFQFNFTLEMYNQLSYNVFSYPQTQIPHYQIEMFPTFIPLSGKTPDELPYLEIMKLQKFWYLFLSRADFSCDVGNCHMELGPPFLNWESNLSIKLPPLTLSCNSQIHRIIAHNYYQESKFTKRTTKPISKENKI